MMYAAQLKSIFTRRTVAQFLLCLLLMQAILPPALASSLNSRASSLKAPVSAEASNGVGVNVSASDTPFVPATVNYGIELKQISTPFNGLRAIDYHQPSKKILVSANYPSGQPNNFELIEADGAHRAFSNIGGLSGELRIATARDDGQGMSAGGFKPGEMLVGTDAPGTIARVTYDGASVQAKWVTLPNESGQVSGLYIDRTGVFAGDLIAVTTQGSVWRIKSSGATAKLASLGLGLEGVTTVPDDAAKYGPWAGKILVGAKEQGAIYAVDVQGNAVSYQVGINPADIEVIPPHENFYGLDTGEGKLYGAPADAFTGMIGDILIAQESTGTLSRLRWNGTEFEIGQVAQVAQWKQIAFAPAGIQEIPAVKQVYDRVAVVRHAPVINSGRVEGALWQLLGESVLLDGNDTITSDLLVPGTPTVSASGTKTTFSGVIQGTESQQPTGYTVTIKDNASLRYLINRTDPIQLGAVPVPPAASGAQDVVLSSAGQSVSDFTALRHLSISGKAGSVSVPPGTYGRFTATGRTALVLGVENSTTPAVYNLEELNLSGGSELRLVGPVALNVKGNVTLSGSSVGAADNPRRLLLSIAQGALNITGNGVLYGISRVPNGAVTIEGQGRLRGTVSCDLLTVSGGGILQVTERDTPPPPINRPPAVEAGADQTITLPTDVVSLSGTVSDDGLPSGGPLTNAWSKVSGPGTVSFSDAASTTTTATFSAAGTYVLRLRASDGLLTTSDQLTVTVVPRNQAPVVDAGQDQSMTLPDIAQLNGTVSDDALPSGSSVSIEWKKLSGEGDVTFSNPNAAQTTATFSAPGTYTLQLSANDTEFLVTDEVTVVVRAANQAPKVEAGADQTITLPQSAALNGTVTDDGQPSSDALSFSWEKVSGPGTVTFINPLAQQTSVSFSAAGTYVLRLTATDSDLTASDELSVIVNPANQSPVVNAGTDQTITLPDGANLLGSVTDDGLPSGSSVSAIWTKVSGPGNVTFANASSATTTASFSEPGSYVLRLSASDSALTASDEVLVVVNANNQPANQPPVVSAGADRTLSLATPSGVTAFYDNLAGFNAAAGTPPVVVDFDNVQAGTDITGTALAGITFNLGNAPQPSAPLVVVRSADTFTPASINGVIDANTNKLFATSGANVLSPGGVELGPGTNALVENDDLRITFDQPVSAVGFDILFQELDGYSGVSVTVLDASGNTLYSDALMPSGSNGGGAPGGSVFVGFVSNRAEIATIIIDEFDGDAQFPDCNIGFDSFRLRYITPQTPAVNLSGSVTDDGLPSNILNALWSKVSGPGTVTFEEQKQATTRATFSATGTYTLRLTGDDSALTSHDDVVVTVNQNQTNQPPTVNAGADQTVTLPGTFNLNGIIEDDGLPSTGRLSVSWQKVSGPGEVLFANPNQATTAVSFCAPGTYVLRLAVNDGETSASDDVTVSVRAFNYLKLVSGASEYGQPDPNTKFTSDGGATYHNAYTVEPHPTYALLPGAKYINRNPTYWAGLPGNFSEPNSTTHYRTTFTLPADATELSLNVQIYADNVGTIFLNGTQIGEHWGFGGQPGSFTVNNGALFRAGENSLEFDIQDLGGGVTAFTYKAMVTYTSAAEHTNISPLVDAGADQSITQAQAANLSATVRDDFMPACGALNLSWSLVSASNVEAWLPLADNFDDNSVDASRWTLLSAYSGGQLVEQNQRMEFVPSTTQFSGVEFRTNGYTDVRGHTVSFKYSGLNPARSQFTRFRVRDDGAYTTIWADFSANSIQFYADSYLDGQSRGDATITYDPTSPIWLRWRQLGSFYFWDTSTDGVNWTPRVATRLFRTPTAAQYFYFNMSSDTGAAPIWIDDFKTDINRWTSISTPPAVTFSTPDKAATSASFNAPGNYVLRLTASDSQLTSSDEVTVNVARPNQAPYVNAGADQFFPSPGSYTLNASVTDDGTPAGATLSSTWSVVSGPGTVTFTNPNAETTTASFSERGTYVLRLTASDSELTTTDEITVTVASAALCLLGDDFDDNTFDVDKWIALPPSKTTVKEQNGRLEITPGLNVIDYNGYVSQAACDLRNTRVSVEAVETTAKICGVETYYMLYDASTGYRLLISTGCDILLFQYWDGGFVSNQTITYNSVQHRFWRFSIDGTTNTVYFETSPDRKNWTVQRSVNPTFPLTSLRTELYAGTYQPQTAPGRAIFDDLRYDPFDGNIAPSVSITAPSRGATFTAPASISVNADAQATVGRSISKVEFYAGSTLIGTDATSPYNINWNNVGTGNYSLAAVAIDSNGASTRSAPVAVTVGSVTPTPTPTPTPSQNQAPQVNAGQDQTITLPTTLALNGSATDDGLPSGSSVSASWSVVSGPGSVTFNNANALSTTATFSTAGAYVLRLTASDSALTASDEVTITVNPAPVNQAPTASAGPDKTAALGVNLLQNPGNEAALQDGKIQGWTEVTGTWTRAEAGTNGLPVSYEGQTYFRVEGDSQTAELYQDVDLRAFAATINAGTQEFEWKAFLRSAQESPADVGRIIVEYRDATNSQVIATLDSGDITTDFDWHWTDDTRAAPPGTGFMRIRLIATRRTGTTTDVYFDGLSLRAINGAGVKLEGTATDDGLPVGSALNLSWQKVSGPGTVAFSQPNNASTAATFTEAGTYVLRLSASDSALTASDEVTVTISPANQSPVVNAGTDQTITLPDGANLQGSVTDDGLPSGSSVSTIWTKVSGPGNVTFANANATSTTATFSAQGIYRLRLSATDSDYTVFADVIVTVKPAQQVNQAPVVNAGQNQSITLPANTVTLQGTVTDDGLPSGSSISMVWNLVNGPSPVSFGSRNQMTTTVTLGAAGVYLFRLSATDGQLTSSNDVTVTVNAVNQAPVVNAGADQTILLTDTLALQGQITDDSLPSGSSVSASWSVMSGPGSVTFSSPQSAATNVTFGAAGDYVLRLTASDSELSASDDVSVSVNAPQPKPTLEITSIGDGAEITKPVDVIGSVSGGAWRLEYSLSTDDGAATQSWVTINSGNGPVTNGKLGTIDSTLMLNGIYTIRLSATDQYGQTSILITSAIVDKNLKVGNFTISFNDLSVPVAGLPIQITRSYDSRDKRVGDFGAGWTMGISSIRLEKTGVIGRNWEQTSSGGILPTYCLQPTRPHYVTVTFPDGKLYKFQASTALQCQRLAPITSTSITFTAMPGTKGKLEAAVPTEVLLSTGAIGAVDLISFNSPDIYNASLFRLTTEDGTVFLIDQKGGVQSVKDTNNNQLTITRDGITHSSGKSVTFVRDNLGRITRITDPDGHAQTYTYDSQGDLVEFVDRENNTVTYTYNAAHYLLTMKDPRGLLPIRNEYDDSGRLLSQTDAFGKTITYTHDIAARVEVIKDRLGNPKTYEYDERGNILREVDAKGGVKSFTYDEDDNVLTETNALGKTTTYTYDAQGNRTSVTDALGNVTRYTYNSVRQVLTTTDALNHVTTNTYDTNGTNLLSTKDALENTTSYTYNLVTGNRTTMTNAGGGVTHYEYNQAGYMTSETDPLGNVVGYTYDGGGNRLTRTAGRTRSDGTVETLTTLYEYDKLGRLKKTTYPDGTTTQIEYNLIGQQSATIDQQGHRTTYDYDEMGRLIKTTYADGTKEEATYDAEGHRLTSKDRAGRITGYTYDELGRLIKTTYADGTSTSTAYDAIGRISSTTDARGNKTLYDYDPNCGCSGRRSKVTDALGRVTSYTYDGNGNQTSMTDANNHTTHYEYDAMNRRTKVVYPDNTSETTAYDALGRIISKTDQANKSKQFEFDKLGRLIKVTDALSQVTSYTYDEVGNQTSQTDANNHTTRFEYDSMGRRVKRTLPEGMSESYAYDTMGNLKTRTDFNGKTTTYGYDAMRRLLSRTPDASLNQPSVTFTYNPTGRRETMTDASGLTAYTYDARDRLKTKSAPQGALTYTYDEAGNLKSVRSSNAQGASVDYGYDVLNRLSTVTDNRLAAGANVTTYSYDDAGNLQGYAYANGVETTFTYNTLNRLTNLSVGTQSSALASYSYTLGLAGNRLSVTEKDGRAVNYTYDDLYRLTREEITGSAASGVVDYTYDAVGNRLTRSSSLPQTGAQSFSYDKNDRLASESYDANGNALQSNGQSFAYDFENHLASVDNGAVTYLYDGDGNRVGKTANGVTTRYLVDTNNLTGYAQVLDELQGGAVTRSYTYGHDLISQRQLINNQWQPSFYSYDGQGSVRLLTNEQGAVTDTYTYDAFGNLINQTGTTPNEYLYTGERFDSQSGFYYLRARDMNPVQGRFLSQDSYEGNSSDPLSLHKYLYAEDNPVTNIDPSGRTIVDVMATAGSSQVINAMATMTLAYICYLQYMMSPPGGIDFGDSPVPPSPCVRKKLEQDKTFYRGTTYYDALEIVQNQRIDRINLNTGYELGAGLYLTNLPGARYWASYNGRDGKGGGGAVIKAQIAVSKWNFLLRAGAVENVPTSGLPYPQSFVPDPLVPYFNMYARFSFQEALP